MKKLEWYVLLTNFNDNDRVYSYNIFYPDFVNEIKKKKKEIKSYDELKEFIKKWAQYHYWCKAEYELLVGGLFKEKYTKIDVFRQIEMNLDRIVEYVNKELEVI